MKDFDHAFYGRQFNETGKETGITIIDYPDGQPIISR
jgi:hypothetical protein